jgi:Regulator of chromosome condensation (RCC1) repeat
MFDETPSDCVASYAECVVSGMGSVHETLIPHRALSTPSLEDLPKSGCVVFVWGRNDFGQCGRPCAEALPLARVQPLFLDRHITAADGNMFHSAFVTGERLFP